MLLKNFIDFNPKEILSKDIHRKISMDQLKPFCRHIISENYEMFTGGSKFRNGDTIMARITPCLENGKTAYVNCLNINEVAFGSTEFIVARAKEGVSLPLFVYYLLCSSPIRNTAILSMTGSSGRERVQQFMLDNYEIPYYSLSFQQHIVDTIGTVDDLIEKYENLVDKLSHYSSQLYEKYQSIGNANLLKLGEVCEIVTGKLNANQSSDNGKYPFFTCSQAESRIDYYAFDTKAIIIAGNGDISVKYYEGKFNAYQRTYVLNPRKYFYLFLKECENSILSLKSFSRGSVIKFITKDMLQNISIALNANATEFNEKIGCIYQNIMCLKRKIDKLKQVKQHLLTKYFS